MRLDIAVTPVASLRSLFRRYQREASAALAYLALLAVVALVSPGFYSPANLRDLALGNIPVLLVAIGMTLVVLTGQIDISIGSQFAVCGIVAGLAAKTGLPVILVLLTAMLAGGLLGALNGLLVAWWKIPSIVVTLAVMVVLRDGLRWATEGAWVQNLPPDFQWFGLGQAAGQALIITLALALCAAFAWGLNNLAAGRAVYAVGSDAEAARLAGISPPRVVFGVFTLMGALAGLAALLNSVRFSDIQSSAGVGLELKAIAAVVVGGTAINGGRGTLAGTLLGVALLGTIGTSLTFLGINPFWEKAIQGAIILAAVVSEVVFARAHRRRARGEALTA